MPRTALGAGETVVSKQTQLLCSGSIYILRARMALIPDPEASYRNLGRKLTVGTNMMVKAMRWRKREYIE